ncbi:MAG: VWA domain-containing protein [Planctomycetota bacterium]|nr:VWA domain-containing protein [Planctomycetota bacterium]
MNLLAPLIAGVAAAIAVPSLLILYFLKLRRREVEISTTLLWKKAVLDMQANAPFQRLRRNILLILQLIILAAACLALGQPVLRDQKLKGNRHVILIDRSASMSTTDTGDKPASDAAKGQSRLDDAKDEAKKFVQRLREPSLLDVGSGDEAMVIAFDSTAEVRQQFTNNKALLAAAIDAITPSAGPTRVSEAFRLAKAYAPARLFVENQGFTGGEPATIHLWSDGRLPDQADAFTDKTDKVVYHAVGKPATGNLGIIGLRAERAYDDPNQLSVYVGLQNTYPSARAAEVEFSIDGRVVGAREVKRPAASAGNPIAAVPAAGAGAAPTAATQPISNASTGGAVFTLDRAEGAVVSVRLRKADDGADDAFAGDDEAKLIVPSGRRHAVAVVTSGNLFLSSALTGLPLAKLDTLSPAQFEAVIKSGTAGQYDVVVLDGWLPPVKPEEAAGGLPPGRYVVLGNVPTGQSTSANPSGSSGVRDLGKGPPAAVVDWAQDHPALRGVSLDPLVIAESRRVELLPGSPARVLASSDQGPIVLEVAVAQMRAIVVPFDIQQSNWPFDVSFVVFLASAVDYLGADSTAAVSRVIEPGSVLSDRLPSGARNVRIQGPDGVSSDLAAAPDGRIIYGPVRTTGIYSVSWQGTPGSNDDVKDGRAERKYSAVLLDPFESDVRTRETLNLAAAEVAADMSETTGDRSVWTWLVLAGLAIMMLEWFIYNRKVHV